MNNERLWKDVPGAEDRYEVSNDGLVRTKPQILKPYPAKKGGHMQITVAGKRTYVHRIVAEVFVPNKDGKPLVNHKNGNPSDNRYTNLEWVTYGENIAHGYRVNGRKNYNNAKVSAITDNGDVAHTFCSMAEAARYFGVSRSAIRSAVVRGGKCAGYLWVKV